MIMSHVHWQDEEDHAYLMDDDGNIDPKQETNQASQNTVCQEEASVDVWGDRQDDQDYLDSLDDFEQASEEISDQLLLSCMADFDSQ